MREFFIHVYELLNEPLVFAMLTIFMGLAVAKSISLLIELWKLEKEEEKNRNENISVSALDNNKDR